jgi:hypothetical protein
MQVINISETTNPEISARRNTENNEFFQNVILMAAIS